MSAARLALALSLTLASGSTLASGCTTVVRIGSHDAAPRRDDAGSPVPCGPTTCAAGTVCCNESCGICTLPGATCRDIPCTDPGSSPCDGDDAALEGACATALYRWSGATCERITGCSCRGRDCARLRTSAAACFEEHERCWDAACVTSDRLSCPVGYFCETTQCADDEGTCARSRESCADGAEPVVCGCDGAAYPSTCGARRSAVSRAGDEACDLCAARLPTTIGTCATTLGYAWDGGRCTPVRGCACAGECAWLYDSLASCTAAREPCLSFRCDTITCRLWVEVCVVSPSGAWCDALPGACEGVPSCACIADPSCMQVGPGAYLVTRS